MTTGEAIRAALLAAAPVDALVGTNIFPSVAPQGTVAPWVIFQVVSDVPKNALTGAAAGRLGAARVQIDCYSKMYLEAQAISAAVDDAISDSSAFSAWRTVSRDLYDDVSQLYRVSAEFSVWRAKGT